MARIDEITEEVIGSAYRVANELGSGFLEKVYENALAHDIRSKGFNVAQQAVITVHYQSVVVGEYFADLLVENEVLVELKSTRCIDEVHIAQCLNYLKATRKRVCLLLNFGTPRIQIKRLVM